MPEKTNVDPELSLYALPSMMGRNEEIGSLYISPVLPGFVAHEPEVKVSRGAALFNILRTKGPAVIVQIQKELKALVRKE